MSKFTAEIDTDEKTSKFYINGQEVMVDGFCVNSSSYTDMNGNQVDCKYANYCTKQSDGTIISESYSFDNSGNYSENIGKYNINKEIAKIIRNSIAADKMCKALLKMKKPIYVGDAVQQHEMMVNPPAETDMANKDKEQC